ncbi:MAG: hypothetical protein JKX92_10795 [Porticoccaceae bacterium]|nr:hypothetical protein [Porticoccaceae bacterium]
MKLMKPSGLFFLLSLWASSALSLVIDPVVTGADMAGMEVTAFFGTGSESALWGVTSAGPGGPFGEGFSGAASGTGWDLSQQGFTEGNYDSGPGVLGAWTLTNNTGFNITSLRIDALMAGIVFDVIFDSEVTPGSDIGRAFLPDLDYAGSTSAVYSNQFSQGYNDLFGSLTISFGNGLLDGASMRFLADTDAVIPAPGGLWLFAIGLVAMCFRKSGCK